MSHKLLAGAINPFALAEVALGRSIKWSKVADKPRLIESILKTPYNQLFDGSYRTLPFVFADFRADNTLERRSLDLKARTPVEAATALKGLGVEGIAAMHPEQLERLAMHLAPAVADGKNQEFSPANSVWADPGDFFEEGTEFADPVQGALGDCYFIAGLSSVAWARPYAILQRNRATGPAQSQFVDSVSFTGDGRTSAVEVSELLPLRASDTGFIYARSSEAGEIWPAVYEKAYAKWRTGNTTDRPPYDPIAGGDPVAACCEIVAGLSPTYRWSSSMSADDIYAFVRQNSLSRRTVNPMVAWTYAKGSDSPDGIQYDAASGVVGWHAYSILGWDYVNDTKYVVLRNPWGQYEGKADVLSGSWSAYDTSFWRTTPLNAGGVFAMKVETFKKYYAGLGVAR